VTLAYQNNCYTATIEWTYVPLARTVSITMGFEDASAAASPTALALGIRGTITPAGSISPATKMSLDWRLSAVKVFGRDNAGNLVTATNLTPLAGTAALPSGPQPIFTSYVVTKQTALAGRKFRGRMYFPAFTLPETSVDIGGTIAPAAVTAVQADMTAWFNLMVGGGFIPSLLHDLTTPGFNNRTPINALLVRPVLGVQRRRRNPGA